MQTFSPVPPSIIMFFFSEETITNKVRKWNTMGIDKHRYQTFPQYLSCDLVVKTLEY